MCLRVTKMDAQEKSLSVWTFVQNNIVLKHNFLWIRWFLPVHSNGHDYTIKYNTNILLATKHSNILPYVVKAATFKSIIFLQT